ncbi:bifunctional 4-hydroxy-2-oxoglutarate aldolase/2-dehydro-3-deoxy-phosphogluconate aldolase [Leifsonia poae]|uniref:bifunctional 4-hydroxy-2-oxoglutarate aldolase/2-dehydro-3-deoxy-phosphogluconate aldolase n=1 Tax=Leifsonia poae TaxID=110933 RepID=UPI003D66D552
MTIDFAGVIGEKPIIAVLRGMEWDVARPIACDIWGTRVGIVEVPVQGPASERLFVRLAELAGEMGEVVGAGTVISREGVVRARRLGATFTISPGFDPDVMKSSLDLGMPHLPGVATPSEVQAAMNLGATWMKAFPADALGPEWFAAVAGPFPEASFVATGGIDSRNAARFIEAGASALGVGSSLGRPGEIGRLTAAIAGANR